MESSPALAVAEGTMKALPCQVEVASIERIVPRCLPSIHRLPAAIVQWALPCSTILMTESKARGDNVSIRTMKLPAALLTSPSKGRSGQISLNMPSTLSGRRTSQTT